jgi:hypothetical protein
MFDLLATTTSLKCKNIFNIYKCMVKQEQISAFQVVNFT